MVGKQTVSSIVYWVFVVGVLDGVSEELDVEKRGVDVDTEQNEYRVDVLKQDPRNGEIGHVGCEWGSGDPKIRNFPPMLFGHLRVNTAVNAIVFVL